MNSKLACFILGTMALAGCGPSTAVVKQYVITSPRRTVACFPFSVAEHQRNVGPDAENAAKTRLRDYGFVVVSKRSVETAAPVFGARTAIPTIDEVREFGRQCGAPVVLVGLVEQAHEGRQGRRAAYRERARWTTDQNGHRVRAVEQIETRPDQPDIPAYFLLHLELLDTETGQVIWSEEGSDSIPNWSAEELARHNAEAKVDNLASFYLNQKI